MSNFEALYAVLSPFIPTAIYVWGGKGERIPDDAKKRADYLMRKETSDTTHTKVENIERCERLYQKRKSAGVDAVQGFDCSGLIYYGLHALSLLNTRKSSRGYYSCCTRNTDKTGMTRNDLKPGDLVFRHDGTKIVHVALYIGNGKVLESGGRDVGVQVRSLNAKDNRYGRLACMKIEDDPKPTPSGDRVRVKGGTVNIRNANGTVGAILKIARRNETYALLEVDSKTGWYRIDLGDGRTGYISNRADLTEVTKDA